ncbi:MAG: ATP-binding protein [Pseudomonadales bacterium]
MEDSICDIVVKSGSNCLFWQSLEQALENEPGVRVHGVKWHETTACRLRKIRPQILIISIPTVSAEDKTSQRWKLKCEDYIDSFPQLIVIGIDENSADMLVRFSNVDRSVFLRLINALTPNDDNSDRLHLVTSNNVEGIVRLSEHQEHCENNDRALPDQQGETADTLQQSPQGATEEPTQLIPPKQVPPKQVPPEQATQQQEFISNALAWVDLRLYHHLQNTACNERENPAEVPQWAMTSARACALLATDFSEQSKQDLEELEQHLEHQVFAMPELCDGNRANSPFIDICNAFGLCLTERQLLLMALAPELDGRFARIFGFLNDDLTQRHSNASLLTQIILRNRTEAWQVLQYLSDESPLGRHKLLSIDPRDPLPRSDAGIMAANDVLTFLLAKQSQFAHYASYIEIIPAARHNAHPHGASTRELRTTLQGWIDNNAVAKQKVIIQLQGDAGVKQWFLNASDEIAQTLVVLDYSSLLASISQSEQYDLSNSLYSHCITAARITRMHGAILLVENNNLQLDGNIGDSYFQHQLARELLQRNDNVVLYAPCYWPAPVSQPTLKIDREKLSIFARKLLWLDRAATLNIALSATDAQALATFNRFTELEIDATLRQFVAIVPEQMLLRRAAKKIMQYLVPKVVQLVNTGFYWDDIVLPEPILKRLQQIPSHVIHAATVMEEWGYAHRAPGGQGVAALFSGRSGTGKTMAAQIIANALEVNLYQVDLSKVVSKYIGETEKNLDQVFDAAEKSSAVLLFNEADALFGKRTEVRDSHDRHANVEVAYLLQRMEMYSGLVVLTTNLRQNMDKAFIRRLRFIIDFPDPGIAERQRIWRKVFPKQAPLEENMDFSLLARRVELSGGNIQQIAIRAAYAAAAEFGDGSGEGPGQGSGKKSATIRMRHITDATKQELEKLGIGNADKTLAGLAAA